MNNYTKAPLPVMNIIRIMKRKELYRYQNIYVFFKKRKKKHALFSTKDQQNRNEEVRAEKKYITGPKIESASTKLLTFSALLHKTAPKSKFQGETTIKTNETKKRAQDGQLHQEEQIRF